MKKAILILLVAVVAMTAAFANTSDKDGFAIKVDAIGLHATYGAAYRLGNFEFGIGYFTYAPAYSLYATIAELIYNPSEFSPEILVYCFLPIGGLATVEYKFLATEQHEVGAFVSVGATGVSGDIITVFAGAEYDYCFNQNHAAYAKVGMSVLPFYGLEGAILASAFGYRYTF